MISTSHLYMSWSSMRPAENPSTGCLFRSETTTNPCEVNRIWAQSSAHHSALFDEMMTKTGCITIWVRMTTDDGRTAHAKYRGYKYSYQAKILEDQKTKISNHNNRIQRSLYTVKLELTCLNWSKNQNSNIWKAPPQINSWQKLTSGNDKERKESRFYGLWCSKGKWNFGR